MTKERLKKLLIDCMDWIEEDCITSEDVADIFLHHFEFMEEELQELGFEYLLESYDEE